MFILMCGRRDGLDQPQVMVALAHMKLGGWATTT
jgi:hypothetical protein